MSIPLTKPKRQQPYTLQVDATKPIPRLGLSADDAIYWATRTLEILPKSEVAIVRAERQLKVSR